MTTCRECKGEIDPDARRCKHCGSVTEVVRGKRRRTVLIGLGVGLPLMGLVGGIVAAFPAYFLSSDSVSRIFFDIQDDFARQGIRATEFGPVTKSANAIKAWVKTEDAAGKGRCNVYIRVEWDLSASSHVDGCRPEP